MAHVHVGNQCGWEPFAEQVDKFRALRSMYNFFSMGWVVTLACLQGLVQKRGVFLRTPKSRDDSKILGALQVTQWETLIGLIALSVRLLRVERHQTAALTWFTVVPAYSGLHSIPYDHDMLRRTV